VLTTVFATASRNEAKHQAQALVQAGMPQSVLRHFGELSAQATGNAKASAAALADNVAVRAFHEVLAFGSSRGFLTAAIFAFVAVLVTAGMITTGKDVVPQTEGDEASAAVPIA